jgi:hypothetical protein
MKNNCIEVEQLLFGYSNGHHLLETSILLDERIQKKLEVLSDLSGPDIESGFTEYITGYPLDNERYYSISKTWYAPEMKRPGCVWTHMLLVKYEDLNKIKNYENLLEFFIRPNKEDNNYNYSNTINVRCLNDNEVDLKISIDKIKFIEWAVYSNSPPIIIPANTTTDYLYEIYRFWMNQDEVFMKNFSFCTGSLSNRIIGKKLIDLQIIPYNLTRSIGRQNKQAIIIDVLPGNIKYPLWVDYMINEDIMNDFNLFRSCFSNKYLGKQYFEKFANLYIGTRAINKKAELRGFFDFISNEFQEDDVSLIQNNLLQQLLNEKSIRWFCYNSIIDVVLDLAVNIDLNVMNIININIDEIFDLVWENYFNQIKYVLEKFANTKINILGEELIKKIAHKASPNQLPELTNMNLGLCNLIIKIDNKLALNLEIWNQSRDFQLEIINCIELSDNNVSLVREILVTIYENTSFDLCDSLYARVGNIAIITFLDWYYITQVSNDKKMKWINICEKNPNECIKWMQRRREIKDTDLIMKIINVLDPYSDDVMNIDKNFWIDIFYYMNTDTLNEDTSFTLAQFLLPVILLKEELFPDDIVRFSFKIVNNRISEQRFDYKRWEKLEKLLPEVAWYNSWDKCKRLRKAIKQKGYKI